MAFNAKVCPLPLADNKLNVKNHLNAIKTMGLGPADPTQEYRVFWLEKSILWNVNIGDARGRMCCNCRFYVNTTQIKECIDNLPVKDLKASALPLTPKWADIESKPQAYCTLLDITCSPVRTCDFQQMGGPIDDEKISLPKYKNILIDDMKEEE